MKVLIISNIFPILPNSLQMLCRYKKPSFLALCLWVTFSLSSAYAGDCSVSSSDASVKTKGSLAYYLDQVSRKDGCVTNDAKVREQYKEYLGMAQSVHLIKLTKSMDINLDEPLPKMRGSSDRPLIIQVAEDATVRIHGTKASGPVMIAGESSGVIVDRLALTDFPSVALSISSDNNTFYRSRIINSGEKNNSIPAVQVTGRNNKIIQTEIAHNLGVGLLISESSNSLSCTESHTRPGSNTQIVESNIHHNGDNGVVLEAFDTRITDSKVHHNARNGVYIIAESIEQKCALKSPTDNYSTLHAAIITETSFWYNKGEAILSTISNMPKPVDLVAVAPLNSPEMVIVGDVSKTNGYQLNYNKLKVELFLHDGSNENGEGIHFVASTNNFDAENNRFVMHIPMPIFFEGREITEPQLTATLIDEELGNTSSFSLPLDVAKRIDWDNDGIENAQEDVNHDGIVDKFETDPRLADSDGDGLLDGDELGHKGVVLRQEKALGITMHAPQQLDPTNPDSDGDCLPDGLEVGMQLSDVPAWNPTPGSRLQRVPINFSSRCLDFFQEHSLLLINNSIAVLADAPLEPGNITAVYDTDQTSWTDPTNPDTDEDGVRDGEEDWNLDGKRTSENNSTTTISALLDGGVKWLETDPTITDSDGDGASDGDEGDNDGDGIIGPQESDPLSADTDGDGVLDEDELHKYGTRPNQCDSDDDGLSDGIETGTVNPMATSPECRGLQTSGTNFQNIEALSPLRKDSDSDGIPDGEEDSNHNGWLDDDETDPTTADTDGDGLTDYVERTGDLDFDGLVDIDLQHINNGGQCAPPSTIDDVDCDGLPNARDDDSDNDGCSDLEESRAGNDKHGIPAAYNAKVKACGVASSSGGGSVPTTPNTQNESASSPDPLQAYLKNNIKGGGGCSLIITP